MSPFFPSFPKRILSVAVLCLLVLLPAAFVQSQPVDLEASAEGLVKMNIAVLPFEAMNKEEKRKPPARPEGIIENDLILSGRFNTIRTATRDSALFSEKEIAVYTCGSYSYNNSVLAIQCSLRDARTNDIVDARQYRNKEKHLRSMAHRFSDDIVMALFGEKGLAQTRIAYVQKTGKVKEIHVMDYDGHNQAAVTKNKSLNLFPSWSPDNKEIAFVSYKRNKPDIYIAALFSSRVREFVRTPGMNVSPEYSRILSKIVFASSLSGNTEIYTKNVDGNARTTKLTHNWAIDAAPTWSPSGYEIAFTSDRRGKPQIFVMDDEGANVRRLTYNGKHSDSPAWSPRGDKVAYASLDRGKFNIYTITVDGENVHQLTSGNSNNESPSWAPDGRLVTFCRKKGESADIFIMNEDGTEQRQITFTGNCTMPSWSNF